jgi:glycine/D-amino acid oxidase-like deaminating enzyme
MAETFDVVVVGLGLAGAIAAIEAHDRGARVVILEKQTVPGGISICAGGGARVANDVDQATAYLNASSAQTTAEPVLRALAQGMVELPRYIKSLAEPLGATISAVAGKGNYPLPGYETWGFIEVDGIPGLDPAVAYPDVRAEGAAKGISMFALAHQHVRRRGIEVRLGAAVDRLWRDAGEIKGVRCGGTIIAARRAVVLAAAASKPPRTCSGSSGRHRCARPRRWPIRATAFAWRKRPERVSGTCGIATACTAFIIPIPATSSASAFAGCATGRPEARQTAPAR